MSLPQLLKSIPHKFKPEEEALLEKAFLFTQAAHAGQKRMSGEDYIVHPLEAVVILGQIFPDATSLAALFLHDVPENTGISIEAIAKEFGPEIAGLVDGVTKLGQVRLRNSTEPQYIETLRKMFIATSKDVRVMLIKLADRLHNIRTLQYLGEDKQKKIATETLEVYAPIAGRLGINAWKDELEDSAFAVVDTEAYSGTKKLLEAELAKKELGIKALQKELSHILKTEGVKFLNISGRTKRVYSLYKKLKKYDSDMEKINDILAVRITTKSTTDCYASLGAIHQHFQPLQGRMKDYIATPKPNGYQSLHTTVFDREGGVFEIQIRTDLMHEEAERGVAAHWFYTQSGKISTQMNTRLNWVNELKNWQEEDQSAEEFMENLKVDFFRDRIFVLTPKGDAKDLPLGATVIDFAFSVHTDLGYYMMGAKVNGKMSKITQTLEHGDVVEILKSKQPVKVSRDWLASAHTGNARSRIKQYLKEQDKGLIARIGKLTNFFQKK